MTPITKPPMCYHPIDIAMVDHGVCREAFQLLMGAEDYTSAEGLLALAADMKSWAARVRQIDPVDNNTTASMVSSSLDANAEE